MPPATTTPITAASATAILHRWHRTDLTVTDVRPLEGGMVNAVALWQTDGEPATLVVKTDAAEVVEMFEREHAGLAWYRQHTRLPVPAPYTSFADPELGVAGLMMEHIAAPNLSQARLTGTGQRQLQQQLAYHLARLHEITADAFGSPLDAAARHPHWLDVFGPRLEQQFLAARDQLNSRHRATVEALIRDLPAHLPPGERPALIHGDLWATNVLVDDTLPNRPEIRAFIDPQPAFADVEYELAYLRLFHTADGDFFDAYTRRRPLRPGFDHRCRIYWAHTLLLHVHRFGRSYLPMCHDVLEQLRRG
ncbi:MAG: fructosamine kinase family protein [Phycisphaeraceae bacterium]